MPDHIKWERIFTTTYLTTFRTGLPGGSSTQRTLYQFFRTKKHVLDAISRKKSCPFAWGGRDRKFKSYHSDQINIPRKTGDFSFGHSPDTTGCAQVRFLLAVQPCNCYIIHLYFVCFFSSATTSFPSTRLLKLSIESRYKNFTQMFCCFT